MAGKYSILHRYHHNDYKLAKEHMYRQLGSLDDFALHGRQVLVGVYIRPQFGGAGNLTISDQMQGEDIFQGKIVLILKTGPSAFGAMDDPSWRIGQYGSEEAVPKINDWVMVRAVSGEPTSFCGEGAENVMAEDRRGEMQKVYHWDSGWPCRIIETDDVIATVLNPHSVV